jgi:signal transduction histidine kinase
VQIIFRKKGNAMKKKYQLHIGYVIIAIFTITTLLVVLKPHIMWRDKMLYRFSSNELLNADGFVFVTTSAYDLVCVHGHDHSSELFLYSIDQDASVVRDVGYSSFGSNGEASVASLAHDAESSTLHTLFYQNTNQLIHGVATIDSTGFALHTQPVYLHPAWDAIVQQRPKNISGNTLLYTVDREQTLPVSIRRDGNPITISVSFTASDQLERYNPLAADTPLLIHQEIAHELTKRTGLAFSIEEIIEVIHYSRFLEFYHKDAFEYATPGAHGFMQARILGMVDANEDGVDDLIICIDSRPFISSTILCVDGNTSEMLWHKALCGLLKDEYTFADIDDDGIDELLLSMYASNHPPAYDYLTNPPLGAPDRAYVICFDHTGKERSLLNDSGCITGPQGFNQYRMLWLRDRKELLLGTNAMFDRNPKHLLSYSPSTRQLDTLQVSFTNLVAIQQRPGAPVELFDMTTHQLSRITVNAYLQEIERQTVKLNKRIRGILPEMIEIAGKSYYVTTGALQLINSSFSTIHDLDFHQTGDIKIQDNTLYFIAQDFGDNILYAVHFAANRQINPNFILLLLIEILGILVLLLLVQHIRMPLSTGNGSYFILYSFLGCVYYWRLRGRLQSFYRLPKHLSFDKSVAFKMFDDIARDYSQIYRRNLILFEYDVYQVQKSDEMIIFQRISHDAKNQVMLLKLLADEFERTTADRADSAIQDFVAHIQPTIDDLSNAMITLSKFSHINRLYLESVSIHEVLSKAMIKFANHPHFDCIETQSPDTDMVLCADKSLLEIALTNLIANALEAISVYQHIDLQVTAHKEMCTVTISNPCDCSIMHEDQLYTIGYSTKENGSGLGIPIAKAIIEKHEGSLDIQCLRDMFMVTIALPVHEETKRPTSQKSCLIFGF